MGWLTNLVRRVVTDVATEVLMPKMEERLEVVMDRKMRQLFNEVWLPQLRAMWREDMRQTFEQEWLPRLQVMWREDMRQMFEQEWLPRLQAMWREDIRQLQDRMDLRLDSIQGRLDTLSDLVVRYSELRMKEWTELAGEVRSLRSDVDRIKAHIGMAGGDAR